MGQKTNPISNRIGITRGWDSNWCGGKYAEKIAEDYQIRKYLVNRLAKASLSKIVIERTLKLITVTIHAARPGVIIGKGGAEVDKLKEELKKVTSKDVQINIYEVKKPEVDAHIVADSIARQIEGRVSYRRAIKMAVATTMRVGAEGIKVQISGRLGGAEMARSEMFKTMLLQRLTPRWVFSVSRYGYATARSMERGICLLMPEWQPMHRLRASPVEDVTAVAEATAAGSAETANNLFHITNLTRRLEFSAVFFRESENAPVFARTSIFALKYQINMLYRKISRRIEEYLSSN